MIYILIILLYHHITISINYSIFRLSIYMLNPHILMNYNNESISSFTYLFIYIFL